MKNQIYDIELHPQDGIYAGVYEFNYHITKDGVKNSHSVPYSACMAILALDDFILYGSTVVLTLQYPEGSVMYHEYPYKRIDLDQEQSEQYIRCITKMSDGTVWVGTKKGVYRFSPSSWQKKENDRHSIKLDRSLYLAQNPQGSLLQIRLYDEQQEPDIQSPRVVFDPLIINVYGLYADRWRYLGELLKPNRLDIPRSPDFPVTDQVFYGIIHSIYTPDGSQYDTSTTGVYEIRTTDPISVKKLPHLPIMSEYPYGTLNHKIYHPEEDELWILYEHGAYRWDGENWVMQPQLQESEHKHVSAMLKTQAGEYWFSGDNWIEVWKDGSGTLLEMPEEYRKNTYQIGDIIEHNGAICIATRGGGIYIYDDNDDKSRWQHLFHQNGMPAEDINALLSASDGTLWAGLFSGGVMSYKNGRWVKYNASDGVDESTVISVHEDQSGVIWLFNSGSITKFQPERQAPHAAIEAGSKNVYPNDSAVFSVQGRDAWKNTPADELVYSWRVVNEKDRQPLGDWSAYSPQTLVNTQRMQPGAYRFEVHAQDKSRNTSVTPAVASFTVAPYFWTTPAFLVPVMTSVFIAIISLLIWYRNYIKLQYSEERYRRWLDKDAVTLVLNWDEEGNVRYCNESAQAFFRMIHPQFEYMPLTEWLLPVLLQPDEWHTTIQEAVRLPNTHQHCQTHIRVGKSHHWISWYIRVHQPLPASAPEFHAVGVDISEKVAAESALIQEKMSFQQFCEQAQVGILRVNRQNQIVYMNPAMRWMIEAEEDTLPDWNEWADAAAWKGFLWTVQNQPHSVTEALCGSKRKSRQPFYALVSALQKQDSIEMMVLDFTEQKRLQEQLVVMSRYEQEKPGRELHDGLGQMLCSAVYLSSELQQKTFPSREEYRHVSWSLHEILRQALEQSRVVSKGLYPVRLNERGLKDAIEDLLQSYRESYKTALELHYDPAFQIQDEEQANILYRMIREGVFNALKHAEASRIRVHCLAHHESMRIIITDDGKGLPPTLTHRSGMGLDLLSYHAEQLGGSLEIESLSQQGVTLTCTLSAAVPPFKAASDQWVTAERGDRF